MPPKRKATVTPPGHKGVKKGNQGKKECIPALTDDDSNKKANSGKIVNDKNNEEKGFVCFKNNILSPEVRDKNYNPKEVDFLNIELNQLLQQKTKNNLQGSLKWKTFLFPPFP